VFKIFEELSVGASEQMDTMDKELRRLHEENDRLKREMKELKAKQHLDPHTPS
jgi:cell division protein FtsB